MVECFSELKYRLAHIAIAVRYRTAPRRHRRRLSCSFANGISPAAAAMVSFRRARDMGEETEQLL